jgi:hypothetical protein
MNTIATVTLSDRGLTALRAKVQDLNKRAARFNLEPMTVTIEREIPFVPILWNHIRRRSYLGTCCYLYDVRIEGVEPVIKGWTLLARVEFDSILGTMVHCAPGVENIPVKYHEPICEHCNSRRARKDIFVLEGPEGVKAVGRNCLADFIRDGDAESLARYAEFAEYISKLNDAECESEFWEMGFVPTIIKLPEFLMVVALMMRKFGWLGRTKAKELDYPVTPTADLAADYLYGKDTKSKRAWIDGNELYTEPKDAVLAQEAIEWAKVVGGNDYLDNIRKIALADMCNMHHGGYAASIIIAYQKATEQLEDRESKTRGFFGEVGKRYRGVLVKITRIRFIDGQYGMRTIITMGVQGTDTDIDTRLTWFASGEKNYEEGDEYAADFTVKGHEDNQYGKSTIIQRANMKPTGKKLVVA